MIRGAAWTRQKLLVETISSTTSCVSTVGLHMCLFHTDLGQLSLETVTEETLLLLIRTNIS